MIYFIYNDEALGRALEIEADRLDIRYEKHTVPSALQAKAKQAGISARSPEYIHIIAEYSAVGDAFLSECPDSAVIGYPDEVKRLRRTRGLKVFVRPLDNEIIKAYLRGFSERGMKAKREREAEKRSFAADGIIIEPLSNTVYLEGETVKLTAHEFGLLTYLLKNRGSVVPRSELLSYVWGYDYVEGTNVVDVYVRHLRKKLDIPFGVDLIETVHGAGYIIK
ncbi:MAG: winged helix-turn-helix transcriptional regulator [Clostridia bacterium]|nr:winged helix-turn-helix transcriptional regulator [Clostridia bacterium]